MSLPCSQNHCFFYRCLNFPFFKFLLSIRVPSYLKSGEMVIEVKWCNHYKTKIQWNLSAKRFEWKLHSLSSEDLISLGQILVMYLDQCTCARIQSYKKLKWQGLKLRYSLQLWMIDRLPKLRNTSYEWKNKVRPITIPNVRKKCVLVRSAKKIVDLYPS